MAYDVGTAVLHVLPSFRNIEGELKKFADNLGKQLSQSAGTQLADGISDGMRQAGERAEKQARVTGDKVGKQLSEGVKRATEDIGKEQADKIGKQLSGAYERSIRDGAERALRRLPTLDAKVNLNPDSARMQDLRQELHDLLSEDRDFFGTADTLEQLREIRREFDQMSRESADQEVRFNADAAKADLDQIFDGLVTSAQRAAQHAADAEESEFARMAQRAAQEQIRVAEAAAREQQRLSEAAAKAAEQEAQRRGQATAALLAGRQRAARAAAQAELAERERVSREIATMIERSAQDSARRAEEAFNSTWAGRIRRRLTDAYRNIPDLRIVADSTEAERSIRFLREQMQRLSQLRIGVDVDTATARERIADLRADLARMSRDQSLDLTVRVGAAEAAAQLGLLHAEVDRLDGRTIDLDVDVDAAGARAQLAALGDALEVNIGRLGALIVTITSLGPALIPVGAALASTLAAVGTSITGIGIAVATLAIGFGGIGDALTALNNYQLRSQKSAASLAQSEERVAGATEAVQSAVRSLANTRASAAAAARRSAQAIANAERSAAESVARANRRVEDSQRNLARIEVDAREAREALTRAYKDAVDQMADLDSAVRRNALDQREANLDIAEAKRELDKILSNPRATEEQREQAKITYERLLLQMQDLQREGKNLAEQQAESAKKGVEGSDEVTAARKRLTDVEQRLADAQRELDDARAAAVQAQLDGARRVADAQRSAAEQQRQSAFAIQAAQQGVISAQRQLRKAITQSSIAGGDALQALREKFDTLSPAAKRFAGFLFALKPAWDELQATVAENLLPEVQASIEAVLPHLPKLSEFLGKVAKALGGMFRRTAELLSTDPHWRRFFGFVGKETVPTLDRLWRIGAKVSTGLIALFNAFTPFNTPVGEGLEGLATRFERWATTLEKTDGWQKFLAYMREQGPQVVELLKQLGVFAVRFVIAAAPIGAIVLQVFTKVVEAINKIPIDVLTVIIGTIAGVAAAIGILGAITTVFAAGAAALVVVAAGAIAAAFAVLLLKVDWLREAWIGWNLAVGASVMWLYNSVIKPIASAIAWTITNVIAPPLVWWYEHVVVPIWQRVQIAFNAGVAAIKVAYGVFQIATKVAGLAWRALYDVYIYPTWQKIRPIFVSVGGLIDKNVKPQWESGVKALGKIWDGLIEATKVPIRFVVNTVLNDGILAAYNSVAKKFGVKPDDVKVELPKGFRSGGAVVGPGTAVSDSIYARLSNGEHVWTAAEVAAAGGHRAVEALRRTVLGDGPGFRDGGPVGDGIGELFKKAKKKATDVIEGAVDFFRDPAGTLKELADKLLATMPGQATLPVKLLRAVTTKLASGLINSVTSVFAGDQEARVPGGLGNPLGGSAGMMRVLRAQFPGLRLISGYRPGAVTLSGKRSYHALDRAVDLPPIKAVAKWIHDTWGRYTKELITPFQEYNLLNGRPHRYTGAIWNQHNFAGGNAHDHWAYDSGGMLPPGVTTVFNGTGRPEPVLTGQQWDQIATLARNSHAEPREVVQFHFREAALDEGRLVALLNARDARARPGRPI